MNAGREGREGRWHITTVTDGRGVAVSRRWWADDSVYTIVRDTPRFIVLDQDGEPLDHFGMVSDAIDCIEEQEAHDAAKAAGELKIQRYTNGVWQDVEA